MDSNSAGIGGAPARRRLERYSHGAMALHWLIAAAFVFQIGLGWQLDGPRGAQTFAAFQLHKSVGITILVLTLLRIVWRLTHRPPPLPATLTRVERLAAQSAHIGFYVLLLGLPLTGWLLVSSSATAIPTILYGIVPWPHVPGVAEMAAGSKAAVNGAADFGHHALIYASYLLIALHIAGALKHQFVDRDGELGRMLPLPRRMLGIGGLVAVVALIALVAIGSKVALKPIAVGAPAHPASATPVAPAEPVAIVTAPPAATATSEPEAPVAAEASEPSEWKVRTAASSIRFRTAWSQGPVDGRFATWKAAIRFSPDALETSSVTVTVNVSSAKTGVPDTESALPGSDWFAADAHPQATYTATKFRHVGDDRYEAKGSLSLRGVSRPLVLPFTLRIVGDVATLSAQAGIDRTLFGVGQGEWTSTADLPALVSVSVALIADRKPAARE